MSTKKWLNGSSANLLTTELNSLANNNGALQSGSYDNRSTGSNNFLFGQLELNVTFGSAPTAGNLIDLFLIPAPDGTNYDDGAGGATPVAPQNCYVGSFIVRAVTSAQKLSMGMPGIQPLIKLPPYHFKALLVQKSGQAFPASGSTLVLYPFNLQDV
jgi:hypothetical protein